MGSHWLANRWVRALFGAAIGVILGLVIYQASQMSHRELIVLGSGLAGAAAALLVPTYRRSVRLTGITVSVPQFSELQFAVTKDSERVAWQLFVESVTRISSQPMGEGHGLLREAMTSLHGLFATTREMLKQTQPSRQTGKDPTVEHLAIAMLNLELRPFLSRWHPRLHTWEAEHPGEGEAGWPHNADCRASLAAMQARLLEYILAFGRLAGVPNASEIVVGTVSPHLTAGTSADSRPREPTT